MPTAAVIDGAEGTTLGNGRTAKCDNETATPK